MASYSILIKGGEVASGTKLDRADVGIKGDKIQDVGDLGGSQAEIVIDASDSVVSPGFIDLTNHSDTHWTIFSEPAQESMLSQGITTILGGNCGSSLAPLVKGEDIEGIQKWIDVRKVNINWRKVSEFFEELEKKSLGVNFATLVGHGTLRRGVIGNEARAAREEEIDSMAFLLGESIKEGAFGLSTNLGAAHGRNAQETEISELLNVVSKNGGLSKHHLKDEGKNVLPSIVELIRFTRNSGARTQFSHFKILGRSSWHFLEDALNIIESAREEGMELTIDMFPYTRTGSNLYQLLPPWMLEGGKEKILIALANPEKRREAKAYLKSLTLHYDRMTIASTLNDETSIGKSIASQSVSSGLEPEEFILALLETNGLAVSIFNEVISPEHLERIIKYKNSMISSDGEGRSIGKYPNPHEIPHPRSYGAYPRAFEIFSKQKETVSVPELIYKMTELPASVLGIKDRGRIKKGFFADLVVFRPEEISSPGSYENPVSRPNGISCVLVNGKIAVGQEGFNGELAGRLIRKT